MILIKEVYRKFFIEWNRAKFCLANGSWEPAKFNRKGLVWK